MGKGRVEAFALGDLLAIVSCSISLAAATGVV